MIEEILAMGVNASGQPLNTILDFPTDDQGQAERIVAQHQQGGPTLGVLGDFEIEELSSVGWGIVFPSSWTEQRVEEVLEKLKPLVDLRQRQCGSDKLFKIFRGDSGRKSDQDALRWLNKRLVKLATVDPTKGVPFYLLLIGSPEDIPFDFQYFLDSCWGVGRLYFERLEDYQTYAQSVVDYETATTLECKKEVAIFSTRHDFDKATQLFTDLVSGPLAEKPFPLGGPQGFRLRKYEGGQATKQQLESLLAGGADSPSLLFTGGHGMQFPQDDERLNSRQGALVCQNWPGYGEITDEHWFDSSDIPKNSTLKGLVLFSFACFSAGTPQLDDFDRVNGARVQLAKQPFLSELPTQLLARGHALAVFGHVDRAWAYSFQGPEKTSQPQGFRDVLARIMRGQRLGSATDQFNNQWGVLANLFLKSQEDREHDKSIPEKRLSAFMAARNDARNYVLLGDPAVRLRPQDLT